MHILYLLFCLLTHTHACIGLQTQVLFAICMSLVLASGQFLATYDNSYRSGYDSLTDDFGSSSFGGLNSFSGGFSGLARLRDPRQNRGKKNTQTLISKNDQNFKTKLSSSNWFGVVFSNHCIESFYLTSRCVSSTDSSIA